MNFFDRIKDTTITVGAGDITVSGTPPAQFNPLSDIPDGTSNVAIMMRSRSNAEWELSYCTKLTATTFSRDTLIKGSNGASHVVFSAGIKDIYVTESADQFNNFLRKGAAAITTIVDPTVAKIYVEQAGVLHPILISDLLASLGTTAGNLTNAGALSGSDIVTVSQDGNTEVKTTLTALAAAIAAINGAPDTTAPTASSAAVANSTPTIVNITMSEAMSTSFVPAASAFAVSGHTVSSVGISGSTINLTLSAAFTFGEAARTVSYTQPGTNNARDLAGNLLANFSGMSITNNVGDSTAPTFVSASVENAAPTDIVITMSETLGAFTPAASAFTLSGGKTASSVARSGATITVTANSAYAHGDTVTVQYTKPGSNPIQDPSGNQTASFGPSSVTNNIAGGAPAYVLTVYEPDWPGSQVITGSGVAGSNPTIKVATAGNATPVGVNMMWSKSTTVPPCTYLSGGGNIANNNDRKEATHLAGWVQGGSTGQSGYGHYHCDSLYMWGTAGNWYLWIITDDGFADVVRSSGTPRALVLT